ncbi:MAG: polysaccharide biosynthesis tyrosine autokinase [Chlorobi bacterium]|nr:polysaccharide biosynthesis tyrosine autokinase [Chlorobiota bacterium]
MDSEKNLNSSSNNNNINGGVKRNLNGSSYVPERYNNNNALNQSPNSQQQISELVRLQDELTGGKEKQRFSVGDYIGMLWRGRWVILSCLLLTGAAAAYYTFSQPFVYETSMQILIDQHNDKLDPITRSGQMSNWEDPQRNLKKELQIINSTPIFEETAKRLILQRFLDSNKTTVIPIIESAETAIKPRIKNLTPEQVHKKIFTHISETLKKLITTSPSKDADIINIMTKSGDPNEAALIANVYANVYQDDNLFYSRKNAELTKEFLADRIKTTDDSLNKQEVSLKNYLENNGLPGDVDRIGDLQRSLNNLKEQQTKVSVEISSMEKKLQGNKDLISKVEPDFVNSFAASSGYKINKLQQEIADLTIQRDRLRIENPIRASNVRYMSQLKSMEEQINGLRLELNKATEEYKNSALSLLPPPKFYAQDYSPVAGLNEVKSSVVNDEIGISSMKAQLAMLNKNYNEVKSEISQIPEQTLNIGRLKRGKEGTEKMHALLGEEFQKKTIEVASTFSPVRVIEGARPNYKPISPNRILDIIIGCFVGAILGIGIVVLLAYTDSTIYSPDELEKVGLNVLTAIPLITESMLIPSKTDSITSLINGQPSPHLLTHFNPKSPVTESYRSLRTAIQFASINKTVQTLLITSSIPQEGKSTTSTNTAIVFAQNGLKTLLIDCDLRRPVEHSIFNVPKEPGLVNCLVGSVTTEEAIVKTGISNLDLLTAGTIPPNPSELIGSRRMMEVLNELKGKYDMIVIDSPPIGAVTDGVLLSTMADATVLVTRAKRTKIEYIEKTLEELERVGVKPIGSVLNDFDVSQSYGSTYKYYRYYRYYNYYGQNEEAVNRKDKRAKAAEENA